MTSTVLPPLRLEEMTSSQLVRRAKLVEAVIALINEGGGQNLQMREVAERSGVALGTVYRYFGSKDHLCAVALIEWQHKLVRRVATGGASEPTGGDAVVSYLRRAVRAFHRNPGMAALMVSMLTSTDPNATAVLDRMAETSGAMMGRLLAMLPAEDRQAARYALDFALTGAITSMATGRTTVEEAIEALDGVARLVMRSSGSSPPGS